MKQVIINELGYDPSPKLEVVDLPRPIENKPSKKRNAVKEDESCIMQSSKKFNGKKRKPLNKKEVKGKSNDSPKAAPNNN